MFLKPLLIYGESCDANASEAGNMKTIPVAPTETERSGLIKNQYATVRSHAKDKHEKPTEMIGLHLENQKVCCRCKETKFLDDFYKSKSNKDGHQRECKSCHSIAQMKWQSENREKANSIAKRYNSGRGKEYVKENSEKIKEYLKEYSKKWRSENVDKCRNYKTNRRARVLEVGGTFTNKEFRKLCEKYGNKCLCCGSKEKLHADHVIPISRGGMNSIENIQPLCKTCNMKKATKTIDYR